MLNEGLKGPRDPALASRTTRRTSLVISPIKKNLIYYEFFQLRGSIGKKIQISDQIIQKNMCSKHQGIL